jgi:GTP-binding protein YchF
LKLECGFVGLPNVGKSTLFRAVTGVSVPAGNFPFCTVDPHHAFAQILDERLEILRSFYQSESVIPATLRVRDIAGLVKGAHRGEGLGNAFLSHIREVHSIVHVVRCFEDSEVIHVEGHADPIRDFELIQTELLLADLQTIENIYSRLNRRTKGNVEEQVKIQLNVLIRLKEALEQGKAASTVLLQTEDEQMVFQQFFLLTAKPQVLVANLGDEGSNAHEEKLRQLGQSLGWPVVSIQGKLEAEFVSLSQEEKAEFSDLYDLSETGLARLILEMKNTLGIKTFFTAGPKETRSWTVTKDALAPECAGEIHSDMERGFIAADVYHVDDLQALPKGAKEASLKEKGLLRKEGRLYKIQDGDVVSFLFNV